MIAFFVVLATVTHPFSPGPLASLAEKHFVVENGSFGSVIIVELALFAFSYSKFIDRGFSVAVVATIANNRSLCTEALRRPSRWKF
jgi:hypothetical protein